MRQDLAVLINRGMGDSSVLEVISSVEEIKGQARTVYPASYLRVEIEDRYGRRLAEGFRNGDGWLWSDE